MNHTYKTSILCFCLKKLTKKLCQNYTKTGICQILYKSCSIKQIIFNNYATNLKTTISHSNLKISGLLLLYIFNFYFASSINIIDNIITYYPFSPYNVTSTSANGSAVNWSRDFRLFQSTISYLYGFHPTVRLKIMFKNETTI